MKSWQEIRVVVFAVAQSVFLLLLTNCSSVSSYAHRTTATGIEQGDMIAVVPNIMGDTDDAYESSLTLCIRDAMNDMDTHCRFMFQDEFRKSVFSDLKQSERPLCADITKVATTDSRIYSLLNSLGIRYLVCVSRRSSNSTPPQAGGGGGYGGGIFFISWTKYNRVEASIYDLTRLSGAGWVNVYAEDTGAVGIVPPLYIPNMAETKACKRLGKEVAHFLTSKEQPPLQNEGSVQESMSGNAAEIETADEQNQCR
jgi:hypothetical protein